MNEFKYTTAIKKIRAMKGRKKVIQGGTSSGKTFGIIPILIDQAIKNPGLEISIVSESIPHLRRGALKDFLKIMRMTNRFISKNYNRSHLKYTFTNSSYIEFFSVDDEAKLRGARRNVLYVNEANNIHYDAYLQLAIRTSGDIYIDFNPTHRFWAHTEVLSEPDSEHIILTYKDNEGLPESIVKELEMNRDKAKTSSYWANWWRVYGLGQIGSLEGVIFSNWQEIKIDLIPESAKLLGYGLDFGFTNDPTALVAVYKYGDKILLDELIYQKGLTNAQLASKMEQVMGDKRGIVYADSAEPKSIAELRSYGMHVLPAKKGKDSIIFGISLLQEYEMLVTARSNNLKDELRRYSWVKDRDGTTLNVPISTFNHAIDAIRYLAMMTLKKRAARRNFRIG